MNWTFGLSVASLVYGVLFYILAIVVIGASPVDVPMMSTALAFLLLGGFGLLAAKFEAKPAA